MSQLPGAATLIELAPEGLRVEPGDVVARFDPSAYQHDVLRLERDYAMARAELEGLERARQPLELAQMAHEAREAEAEYQNERLFLEDNRLLAEEGLVSPQEVERQGLKVEQLRQRLEQQRERAELTAAFLHPAQLERARAEALAADQALELARGRLAASTVRAPVAGLVVYVPTHLGGEYRAVRVGDPVYLNQVFLIIPDMGDLLAVCYVPEGDLNRVRVGHAARIAPVALPDLQIEATVEQVGLMAQNRPGAQSWQRVFRVRIALAEGHPDLRTGMTVQVRILAHRADDVLLAPRAAVFWEAGQAYVWRRAGRDFEAAPVELGWADAKHFEVRAGLVENTEVRLE